jgi:hypothetical protein
MRLALLIAPVDSQARVLELTLVAVCLAALLRLEVVLRQLVARVRALTLAAEDDDDGADERATRADGIGSAAEAPPAALVASATDRYGMVRLPELTPVQAAGFAELRARALELPLVAGSAELRAWLGVEPADTDTAADAPRTDTLACFLFARTRGAERRPDVAASLAMLASSARWRLSERPAGPPTAALRAEAATGKVYVAGIDAHGRPVVVFDYAKENHVGTLDSQMAHLAFELEYATTLLRASAARAARAGRFLLFVKLTDFTLATAPSVRTTVRAIRTLLDNYPERLGQCILFETPAVFARLWAVAAAVLPRETAAKVVFVRGDVAAGSANDRLLCELVGPRWRELTGATRPLLAPGCSSGFHIDDYWRAVLEDNLKLETADGASPLGPDWPMVGPAPAGAGGEGGAGERTALTNAERSPSPPAMVARASSSWERPWEEWVALLPQVSWCDGGSAGAPRRLEGREDRP